MSKDKRVPFSFACSCVPVRRRDWPFATSQVHSAAHISASAPTLIYRMLVDAALPSISNLERKVDSAPTVFTHEYLTAAGRGGSVGGRGGKHQRQHQQQQPPCSSSMRDDLIWKIWSGPPRLPVTSVKMKMSPTGPIFIFAR